MAKKKVAKTADAAKSRAVKKEAKRTAKIIKDINKPKKVTQNQVAARAAAKRRAELKAPNTRTAADKLAMSRLTVEPLPKNTRRGGGMAGGLFGTRIR